MSVINVEPRGVGRTAFAELGGNRVATAEWVVTTDDKNNDAVTAIIADGIPLIGDQHPNASRLYLKSKGAKLLEEKEGAWKKWVVSGNYQILTRQEKEKLIHPWDRPTDIRRNGVRVESAAVFDINGMPILNMARKPYDPPLVKDDAHAVEVITRNKKNSLGSLLLLYMNALNDAPWRFGGAGMWKIQDLTEELVHEEFGDGSSAELVEYWPRTATIEFNPYGWDSEPLNAGRHQRIEDALGNFVSGPIYEADGNTPISEPVPLDIDGSEIDHTTLPGAAIFGVFKSDGEIGPAELYFRRPYTNLQLF